MSHHPQAYTGLIRRLNRFPQGAPASPILYRILQVLFSKKEAELVSRLPIRPFTAERASKAWGVSPTHAAATLNHLAERALLVDIEKSGATWYVLPPPMAGFIEFSLMRVRNDLDQNLLAELFYQYINQEEEFIRALFLEGSTSLGRVFVQERALSRAGHIQVLDYERASHVIKSASHIGISMCYCRRKKHLLGMACQAPMDICMTFNTTASALTRHGHARRVDATECLTLLGRACDNNLVQFGDNCKSRVNFICNCCPCCCEALVAARKIGFPHPIATTGFLARINPKNCTGCGKCMAVCPVQAISPDAGNPRHDSGKPRAHINPKKCLGCGVCVRNCPSQAIWLTPRKEKVIPPLHTAHRAVVMAIERGKLQHLIFDNQVLLSHRMLALVLGVILNLPPVRRIMATEQIQSRFVEALIARMG